MTLTLEKIRPLHPDFTIDPSWERMGMTPSGHQLFKETTPMVRAVPDIDEETGRQRQMLHPTTAQPLYPLNKAKHYNKIRTFYLYSEGNGNITKVDWSEPSEEEIAALAREDGIKELMPEIAGELYDIDMTPKELAQALRMIGQAMKGDLPDVSKEPTPAVDEGAETPHPVDTRPVPDPDVPVLDPLPPRMDVAPQAQPITRQQAKAEMQDEADEKKVTYPYHIAGGKWELSDGSIIGPGPGLKDQATAAEAALHDPVPV
jgi:hypothetical protein